jgi:mannose-6-phosphate isomerase-like protein (cupin superfamily)
VPHVVGKLGETSLDLGVYDGHAESLTRRPLFARAQGAVHHSVVHNELDSGRIDSHLHAFEEGLYVLSGALTVELGGTREELGADDYVWIELGVPHSVAGTGAWLEVSAPLPGASLEDTVFSDGPGARPDVPYRRGHFDVADLPEPSGAILAGAGANVGGASVKLLINADFGASQFVLMALRYVEGGRIKEHDHAFEEGFFFLEGEVEAELDGETYTLGPGDYCWSSVEGMHALTNRSSVPVRWLETQAPQPPSRHQFRYRVDWERIVADSA